MAVLGRLLVGSAERLDLPDLLAIDSYTAADFKYLIRSFIGGNVPYVLRGFDVIQPQGSIGTESISIRVADSVVYFPQSGAGSFYFGLEEGNENALPLIPELRKNATNFVYLTFSTFDSAKDSRAFWDPDQNGGQGGEFSQDVNTESVLKIEVNVSVSTFPEDTIPICKVVVGPTVISSIEDCRHLMFRLGTGGTTPDPFANYTFRNEPTSTYSRAEPPTTLTSSLDPNPFQGGDKNIFTLKEWMDVVMTKLKEIGGTTYWYEGIGTAGPSVSNTFLDALGSTLKSKGEWQHDESIAGNAIWTEDIHYVSLIDPRDVIFRAGDITIPNNDQVAYFELVRDTEINNSSTAVTWQNASNAVNGVVGAFENLAKGDWIKKLADSDYRYLRVEEFYALTNLAGGTTTAALAQSVRLSDNYTGTTGSAEGVYTKGEYLDSDMVITDRDDPALETAGGNFYWMAYRSDTILGGSSYVPTQLTIDITEADGERARCTSTVAHGLEDGDRITIVGGAYDGTHQVEVEDSDNFFINTTITGDDLGRSAFYAIVTTAARDTAYGYNLETAEHGLQSNQRVYIDDTLSLYDGSYLVNVRTPTTFQIPIGSLIPDPGSIGTVTLVRLNVRTEFGAVKVVQGETINIGDFDTKNLLTYVGMPSLAQTKPVYSVPSSYNALNGFQNYNSDPTDDLTVRAAKLTAMMADRVQDRDIKILGRVNIYNETNGLTQDMSASGTVEIIKPSSPTQVIDLTVSLPVNSVAIANIDRDGGAPITLTVESLGSPFVLSENKILMFYRFSGSVVYNWTGAAIPANGHLNLDYPEDSQNRNISVYNPGTLRLDIGTNLVTLDVKETVEETKVSVSAGAFVPQSSYFLFNSANDVTEYYVWYDVDAGGVDPAVVGKTGIQVSILSTDSADDVATATAAAILGVAAADVNVVAVDYVVTITNLDTGPTTDAEDGAVPTNFTIELICGGTDPDIEIIIPGSAGANIIDVDAINATTDLLVQDGYAVWLRIDRFAAKTFNTIETTDVPDSNVAGALYITPVADVPIDQDVFILFLRTRDSLIQTHKAIPPEDNVYSEYIDIISGIPSNMYEITGPIATNGIITLPPDQRDDNSNQRYVVGAGHLKVFLNGQLLRLGEDWEEVGGAWCESNRFRILQDLEVGDTIEVRIDSRGAVYFASSGVAGGGTLQQAYDNGRFITTGAGQPVVINSGSSGIIFVVDGDMQVTGRIEDTTGISYTPQATNPLDPADYGTWVDTNDDFIFERGALGPVNLSRAAGTHVTRLENNSGSLISKFTPVRIDTSGDIDTIDVSVTAEALAIVGLTDEDVADGDDTEVVTGGRIENVVTSAVFGDAIWVSKTGGLTNVAPSIGVGGFVAGDWVIRLGVIAKNYYNPPQKDLILGVQIVGRLG